MLIAIWHAITRRGPTVEKTEMKFRVMAQPRRSVLLAILKIEPRHVKTSPDSHPNGDPSLRALEGV